MNNNNVNFFTILITGAERGLGKGIINSLLINQSQSERKYKIILTSYDEKLGNETVKEFNNSFGELKEKLLHKTLDITKEESIKNCVNWIKNEIGPIDILVNNAGVVSHIKEYNSDIFDWIFGVNFYGTVNLTEQLLGNGLIKKNGKIVTIASGLGNIMFLAENLQKEFRNDKMTVDELFELSIKFKTILKDEPSVQDKFGISCYSVSKMLINKYTDILGRNQKILENGIQVYSCCPGHTKTEMGGPDAERTIEEGVKCPVYLIDLEHKINQVFQGKFFYDCKITFCGL